MITTAQPLPSPGALGLAWDGTLLWCGDDEARTISPLTPEGTPSDAIPAPGRPLGLAFTDDALAVVIAHPESDSRTIRFLDPQTLKWLEKVFVCPDDSGSQLAWDGAHLWLAQRHDKRIHQLHEDGTVKHTIDLPYEVTGFAWLGASVWLNLRVEKAVSEIARRGPGAAHPTRVGRFDGRLISLAHDGASFWAIDAQQEALVRIRVDESSNA